MYLCFSKESLVFLIDTRGLDWSFVLLYSYLTEVLLIYNFIAYRHFAYCRVFWFIILLLNAIWFIVDAFGFFNILNPGFLLSAFHDLYEIQFTFLIFWSKNENPQFGVFSFYNAILVSQRKIRCHKWFFGMYSSTRIYSPQQVTKCPYASCFFIFGWICIFPFIVRARISSKNSCLFKCKNLIFLFYTIFKKYLHLIINFTFYFDIIFILHFFIYYFNRWGE